MQLMMSGLYYVLRFLIVFLVTQWSSDGDAVLVRVLALRWETFETRAHDMLVAHWACWCISAAFMVRLPHVGVFDAPRSYFN
jgi:hypothetical protein